MADDSDSPDKIKKLDDRLSYLETVARDTVARLYEIEKRLGLVFQAVPRELKTTTEGDRNADSRLSAIEETLKPATPSEEPGPHIGRPMGDSSSEFINKAADKSSIITPPIFTTHAE